MDKNLFALYFIGNINAHTFMYMYIKKLRCGVIRNLEGSKVKHCTLLNDAFSFSIELMKIVEQVCMHGLNHNVVVRCVNAN